MITWHFVTRAAYDAATEAEKTSDKLFFLSDTGEIYRGTQNFSQSIVLYADEPSSKAVGKLYVDQNTLEGKVWNGSAWTTVIQPVQSSVSASNTNMPVSGKAVSDFVGAEIAKVTGSSDLVTGIGYDSGSNKLTVSMADGTSDEIEMSNVAADLSYNSETGLLQVKNAQGTAIGTGINLDLERFVDNATYDHEAGTITLTFNRGGDPLVIDIGDLVDTYTAKSSSTINLTVTGNEFTAEAIVSSADGNMLQKTEQGLYVAVDLAGYMVRDTDAVDGNLAKFDSNGHAVDAGITAGGATLAASASASVLATEAAVDAIRTALQTAIDSKMAKVATGKANQVLTATTDGNAQASGYTLGGATLAASPNASTLASEAAVKTYVTGYAVAKDNVVAAANLATTVDAASDTDVPSEKALVQAMSWYTTV